MFERYTEKAIKVIMLAQEEARRLGHNFVGTEQILLGLIGEGTGVAAKVLKSLGVSLKDARIEVEKIIGRGSGFVAIEIPFTPRSKRVLEFAWNEARQLSQGHIGTEHLLLGILREGDGVAIRVIENIGVDPSRIRSNVIKILGQGPTAAGKSPASTSLSNLDSYGVDWSAFAELGRFDPLVGRELEVSSIMRVLARRTTPNPLLVGPPGVGKTAIVRGLAARMVAGDVPDFLREKRLIQLDPGKLAASVRRRGEIEARLESMVVETRVAGNVIVIIDDLDTFLMSGSKWMRQDISNALSVAFTHNELQCIAMATPETHQTLAEVEPVFERCFQPLNIQEPSTQETLEILQGLRERYETYHRVEITEDALTTAVELADRNLQSTVRPAGALDLLDEAAALGGMTKRPSELREAEMTLKTMSSQKEKAIRDQDFTRAFQLRQEEAEIRNRIKVLVEQWRQDTASPQVSSATIEQALRDMLGYQIEESATTSDGRDNQREGGS